MRWIPVDEQNKEPLKTEEATHEKPEKEKKKSEKDKLKDEIESLKSEIASLKDHYLRERAELENYKKRIHQERINERKYASQNVIESFLGPLDQLKIVTNMTVDNDLLKNYLIGFKMIND